MNKESFLHALKKELRGLSDEDLASSLDYYAEMIDDRVESGMSESEAVCAIGSPSSAAHDILLDMPLPKILKSKYKKKSHWRAWEIVLLVLGSPIWLSLLIAAFAVIFSLYTCLFAVLIALWAVSVAFGGAALGGIVVFITSLFTLPATSFVYLGAALVFIGLSLSFTLLCVKITPYFGKAALYILKGIKSILVGKEHSYE